MKDIIKKLEEQTTFIQQEILQMSDELYAQQKEILNLNKEIEKLKSKLHIIENDSGIGSLNEETLPPHY